MNALAGTQVSTASHRRPHTDHVLAYRHHSAELPETLIDASVPWHEIQHGVDAIEQIVLCDLPDFDSLLGEHRERVIEFLTHLDLLVWVTSPEKYADFHFHQFLKEVAKAEANFVFVLNKIDLFFQDGRATRGYGHLDKLFRSFQAHLQEAGLANPLIYGVSALDLELNGTAAPWNQFPQFRNFLFQNRDNKEITAIKSANLDVEVQRLVSVFEREVIQIHSVRRVLDELIGRVGAEKEEWMRGGGVTIQSWLDSDFRERLQEEFDELPGLVGPGRALHLWARDWKHWMRGSRPGQSAADELPAGDALKPLGLRLEQVENRTLSHLHQRGLPPVYVKQIQDIVDARRRWGALKSNLSRALAVRRGALQMTSRPGFRLFQHGAYGLLTAFLAIALVGQGTWQDFVANPSWMKATGLVAHILFALFSPHGLGALATYLVLILCLAWRFGCRYKKLLQRHVQKFIESLNLDLQSVLEDALQSMVTDLKDYDRQLGQRLAAMPFQDNAPQQG
jgi:hypothetical protein